MKEILVSVIVPVYNLEKLLDFCIKSLVNQTYENLEIILVDDGSTDASGAICDSYQECDSRIHVIHSINKGVSEARNQGIERSTGDYIMFVDGDDWLDLNYVEKMVQIVREKKQEVDLVFTGYIREYKNQPIENRLYKDRYLELAGEELRHKLLRRFFGLCDDELKDWLKLDDFSAPWGKLCRGELIRSNRFIDMKQVGNEDGLFNLQWLSQAKQAIYCGDLFYHYNKQNDISLIQNYKAYLFQGWKNRYAIMRQEIEKNKYDPTFVNALENRVLIELFALMRNLFSSTMSNKQQKKVFMDILSDGHYNGRFKKFNYNHINMELRLFLFLCNKKAFLPVKLLIKMAEWLKKYLKK